jgi:hypothetical protein
VRGRDLEACEDKRLGGQDLDEIRQTEVLIAEIQEVIRDEQDPDDARPPPYPVPQARIVSPLGAQVQPFSQTLLDAAKVQHQPPPHGV